MPTKYLFIWYPDVRIQLGVPQTSQLIEEFPSAKHNLSFSPPPHSCCRPKCPTKCCSQEEEIGDLQQVWGGIGKNCSPPCASRDFPMDAISPWSNSLLFSLSQAINMMVEKQYLKQKERFYIYVSKEGKRLEQNIWPTGLSLSGFKCWPGFKQGGLLGILKERSNSPTVEDNFPFHKQKFPFMVRKIMWGLTYFLLSRARFMALQHCGTILGEMWGINNHAILHTSGCTLCRKQFPLDFILNVCCSGLSDSLGLWCSNPNSHLSNLLSSE